MITSPIGYLFSLSFLIAAVYIVEKKTQCKCFSYLPVVVIIYALSMLIASVGFFEKNEAIEHVSTLAKHNLLPAMLFLILLQVDLRHFIKLGKQLIFAYLLSVFSLTLAFIFMPLVFNLHREALSAFGALSGSWMGGTANMVAVGSALGVSDEAFGYALIVDSVNYTLWFMLLLFLVPLAPLFNRFSKAQFELQKIGEIGCSCTLGAKRYWLFIALSLGVSLFVQFISWHVSFISPTTTTVIMATLLGIAASFTKLKNFDGSNQIATSMLYLLVAIIGSKAIIESFGEVWVYVAVGFAILVMHGAIMVLGAKFFRLDLFSISVASLANIGGVASAPILAAAYHKSLVGIGVLMAVMGYIIGTFGGLVVGNILLRLAP